jgi:hypothetical protein
LGTGNAAINSYISSIGRPDATAVLGSSGTFVTAAYQGSDYSSIDFPPSTPRGCYGIFDLSGGNTIVPRWFLGTTGPTTGSNVGSDFELVGFNDVGSNNIVTLSVRRADGAVNVPFLSSVNAVPYPQNLLSTVFSGTQSNAVTSNTPTVLFTQSDVNTSNLIAGQNYLVDIPCNLIELVAVGGSGAYLDVGVRLGGNGSFNYAQSIFISGSGLPAAGVSMGFTQIADMGTTNKDIDIVGYLHDANATFRVGANIGGDIGYMKMVT